MEKKRRDFSSEAVSPVIGVMLMLVVTIIIAAAVSAFAGGMVSDQEDTPVAQLDVQLKPGEKSYQPILVFTHLGGDSLKTSDLKIITYYQGNLKHTTDGSLDPMNPENHYDVDDYAAGDGSFISNDGYPCTTSNGDPVKYWGNSTMMPGDVYTTIDAASLESIITTGDFGDVKYGDVSIEMEIIHIPSGKTIFSGEVIY